jgi:hypothetical protein
MTQFWCQFDCGAFGQVNYGGQTMLGSDKAIVGAMAILVLGIIISVMIG